MENPIPFDWDGESWRRFAVCWPDSPQWLALLRGFITYCTRGRSWDGRTGTITDAQQIGRDIANRNLPLEEVILSCSEANLLIKAIIWHGTVVGGFAVDPLPEKIDDSFFGDVIDFRTIGLGNKIGPSTQADLPDTIQATLARLEDLLAGVGATNDNVTKALMILTSAMVGQNIDLTSVTNPATLLDTEHLYESQGLANRLGPIAQHDTGTTLSARMDQIRAAIEALEINVNIENGTVQLPGGEELANIVTELEELGTIWETRSVAETVAQNTNFTDLIAAVNALELQCQTVVETTNLNQTINAGGPCGSAGAGTDGADPDPQTTTPEDESGPPPPGFDSWPEFRQYQCDMAYKIVNDMIGDINTAAVLVAAGGSITEIGAVFVAALLTPIGWAAIITLVISFLAIVALQAAIADTLTDVLNDNLDSLVCALLDGSSVTDSISSFVGELDQATEQDPTLSGLGSVAIYWAKQIFHTMATVDSVNRLYRKTLPLPPGGHTCDCSDGEWQFVEGIFGTGNINANPMILTSVEDAGKERLYICRTSGTENITFTSITGYTPSPSTTGADDATYADSQNCDGTVTGDLYEDDDFPTGQTFDCAFIGLNSSTPFTVTLTRS